MPGDINGSQFKIAGLTNCQVYILDHIAEITVDRCNGCTFFIGPVKSSIFVRTCNDIKMTVACSQFRSRDIKNGTFNIFTCNDTIIESSSDLVFGPFNMKYP